MSFNVGEWAFVSGVEPPLLVRVEGNLQNRSDWYNVFASGYTFAVHEGRLSRET